MVKDYRRELQGLLRRLFQFDSDDLDFGIYRIMNYKRYEIEKFIEKDLIEAVDAEFEKYSSKNKVVLESELGGLKRKISLTLGENALLPSGDLREMYKDSPIAKEYNKKKNEIKNSEVSDQHKAEILSHIYHFFSRYYDEGDFISQRRYSKQNKYAVPYNGEEILLHWANKDQYYIKTGEYFKNYSFRVGEYKVNFRLLEAETDQNNNRSGNRFFLLKEGDDLFTYDARDLTIFFEYRTLASEEAERYSTRDFQKVILEEALNKLFSLIPVEGLKTSLQKAEGEKTLLEKHLLRYTKRNTTDYFIHKDLNGFLSGELDFYIKNEVFMIDDLSSEEEVDVEGYIGRIKVIKSISLKIIDFLSQIEEFQKKLFEKKKFVIKAEYCMTLDLVPEEMYPEIVKNQAQISDWKNLFKLDESKQGTLAHYDTSGINIEYLKSNPYLVLDTQFFNLEFKNKLLESFQAIDDVINGVIIKSDNFQVLKLLQAKYSGDVNFIYIDPPYNTGNDGFIYKDKYQHSSWLSMLQTRLSLAFPLISEHGILACSLDDNESDNLNCLISTNLANLTRIGEFIWRTRNTDNRVKSNLSVDHEYVYIYAKPESKIYGRIIDRSDFKNPDNDPRGPYTTDPLTGKANSIERRNLHYVITNTETGDVYPPDPDFGWITDEPGFKSLLKENLIYWPANPKTGKPRKKRFASEMGERAPISSLGISIKQGEGNLDLSALFGNKALNFPKPVSVIKALIDCCSPNDATVLDFFAGSGTTAQSVIELNRICKSKRKYILVESADYFETILKPRIEKFIYSKDWHEGIPTSREGSSHIFKYIYLEQYEDTLNNVEFVQTDMTIQRTLSELDGYFLRYMLDFETRDSPCRLNVDKLNRPFDYTLKITRNNEMRDEKVDLVETFNYLLGLHVKRIKAFNNNGAYYIVVHGMKGEDMITIVWRAADGLDLEADKEFIGNQILKEFKASKVYINSDFFVDGAISIESEFKQLMGA